MVWRCAPALSIMLALDACASAVAPAPLRDGGDRPDVAVVYPYDAGPRDAPGLVGLDVAPPPAMCAHRPPDDLPDGVGPIDPASSCDAPIPLREGQVRFEQTIPSRPTRLGCDRDALPQRFYRVTVPPGRRAMVRASGQSRLRLRASRDCTSTECVEAMPPLPPFELATLRIDNPGTTPLDQIVSVGAPPGTVGFFAIGVDFDRSSVGVDGQSDGLCTFPVIRDVSVPDDRLSGTLLCAGRISGVGLTRAEDIYRLSLTRDSVVDISFPPRMTRVPWVRVRRACDDSDTETNGWPFQSVDTLGPLVHRAFRAGNYYLIVDATDDGDPLPYDLIVHVSDVPSNAWCSTPEVLPPGGTIRERADGLETLAACPSTGAPQRFYSLAIPPHSRVMLTATFVADDGFRRSLAAVSIADGCQATRCLAQALATDSDAPYPSAAVDNGSDVPRTVIVSASPTHGDVRGTVTLSSVLEPATEPTAPNSTCPGALHLDLPAHVARQDTRRGAESLAACNSMFPTRSLFYAFSAPARSSIEVQVTVPPTSWLAPAIAFADDCSTSTCNERTGSTRDGRGSRTLFWSNDSDLPRNVVLSVSDARSTSGGDPFVLDVSAAPLDHGSTCDDPMAVSAGTTVHVVGPGGSAHWPGWDGARYYAIDVPAGATLVATPPLFQYVLLLSDCSSSPLDWPYAGGPQRWRNVTDHPQRILVAASTSWTDPSLAYDLRLDLETPSPDTQCDTATPLFDGAHYANLDSAGALEQVDTCAPELSGFSHFFTATIPAGDVLTASVDPEPFPLNVNGLRILSACGASSCRASSARPPFQYANAGDVPAHVILAVAGDVRSLSTTIRRADFVETQIPLACDDLSGAALTRFAVAPLPFSVTYYGAHVTAYAAGASGVQLFPDTEPVPSAESLVFDPQVMAFSPSYSALHDAIVRTATFGAPPGRRFVVEWNDAAVGGDFAPANGRGTYQVKFFETTGVVEFHYCVRDPGSAPWSGTGGRSWIGLRSFDPTRFTTYSAYQAGVIHQGLAVRFAPVR